MVSLRKKLISSKVNNTLNILCNSENTSFRKDTSLSFLPMKCKEFKNKNSFILIFQINNINAKHWRSFKTKISQIENVKLFMIKNKITLHFLNNAIKNSKYLKKNNVEENFFIFNKEKIIPLFQGPTCLITFHSLSKLVILTSILKKYSNFNFIAGFYKDMFYTHLDLKLLIKLDNRILLKLSNEIFPLFLNKFINLLSYKANTVINLLEKNKKNLVRTTCLIKQKNN